MKQVKVIEGEDFRRMQLLELDMLVEFDRVCRAHGIAYTICGGTLLGAVRHKGYIPWDDDADIAMLREDYERFRSVAHEMDPSICFFQDHLSDPEYRWGVRQAQAHRNEVREGRTGALEVQNRSLCRRVPHGRRASWCGRPNSAGLLVHVPAQGPMV